MLASANMQGLGTALAGAGLLSLGGLVSLIVAVIHALTAWVDPTRPRGNLAVAWWVALGLSLLGTATMASVGGIDSDLQPWLMPMFGLAAALGWLAHAGARESTAPTRSATLVWANRIGPLVWLLGAIALGVVAAQGPTR